MTRILVMSIHEAAKLPESFAVAHFPKRAESAKKYLRREDLLRSYAAGALVYAVLGAGEEAIATGPYGKPYLLNGGPHFSLSHSGNYALLAVDETPVGADIEKRDPFRQPDRVARRVFTPDELAWMNEAPDTRFYLLWTVKEAVMKLDGRGFSLPPESFSALPLLKGGTIALPEGSAVAQGASGSVTQGSCGTVTQATCGGVTQAVCGSVTQGSCGGVTQAACGSVAQGSSGSVTQGSCGSVYAQTRLFEDTAISVCTLHPIEDISIEVMLAEQVTEMA